MKKQGIYNKIILPGCIALAGLFTSCSAFDDFLTVYPTNQITGEQFWEDKNDLTSVLASCYKQVQGDVMKKMFVWGEFRSDNFNLSSESNENLKNMMNANLLPTNDWFDWSGFYKGIGYCNLVLAHGNDIIAKDPSFTESDWKPMAVEAKTLRALQYFYLVRAFRDVPFVVKSNDTSTGARTPIAQTSSQKILDFLIADLDSVKDEGMTNYGNQIYNRGRITKNAVYALLADMYLWRASKNTCADSASKYPGQAQKDYAKCIEYCNYLIADYLHYFQKEKQEYYGQKNTSLTPLPLYMPTTIGRVEDLPYNSIFGDKNSLESIFEIQFDGSVNPNTVVSTFFGGNVDGHLSPGLLTVPTMFQDVDTKPDQKKYAFSQTDLRMWESVYKKVGDQTSTFQVAKYIVRKVTTTDATNVSSSNTITNNIQYSDNRDQSTCDANWIIYRISDIMLMKAEAISQLYPDGDPMIQEGFNIVKAILDRSNPMIKAADDIAYSSYSTASALEDLVMRERQRELFGEGKRWFDLVRYALRNNNTSKMLNLLTAKYTTNASAIKAKLGTINSLFNPVYKDEMKVNTALKQNPAWETDETIVRN